MPRTQVYYMRRKCLLENFDQELKIKLYIIERIFIS